MDISIFVSELTSGGLAYGVVGTKLNGFPTEVNLTNC